MTETNRPAEAVREPVLSLVDRVSELLFGLFMALTFVGAVSGPFAQLTWGRVTVGGYWFNPGSRDQVFVGLVSATF